MILQSDVSRFVQTVPVVESARDTCHHDSGRSKIKQTTRSLAFYRRLVPFKIGIVDIPKPLLIHVVDIDRTSCPASEMQRRHITAFIEHVSVCKRTTRTDRFRPLTCRAVADGPNADSPPSRRQLNRFNSSTPRSPPPHTAEHQAFTTNLCRLIRCTPCSPLPLNYRAQSLIACTD